MAIFTRKKDSAAAQIESARFELDRITATIADRRKRREAALLGVENGDFREVSLLDGQIADLEGEARLWADRIEALTVVAKREDAEATARRKVAHIERIEAKLAEADQAAETELTAAVAALDAAFRKVIRLREEASAAWPFPTQAIVAAGLTAPAVRAALCHELYRQGGRPFVGGVPGAQVEASLPGGAPPNNELRGQREKIRPIADVLREGSEYASQLMRGKRTI